MSDDLIFSKPFSSYAPYNQETLDQLEDALGLDTQFTARRELAECLLDLLHQEFSSSPQIEGIQKEHVNAIQSVLSKDSGDVPKHISMSGKHPMGGEFGCYEIPAFFLTRPHNQFKKKIFVVKFLILMAIILFVSPKYKALCRRTRIALSKPLPPSEALKLIPESISSDALKILEDSLVQLQESEAGAADKSFAKDLCVVLKDIQKISLPDSPVQQHTIDIQIDANQNIEEWLEIKSEPQHKEQDAQVQNKSTSEVESKAWVRNCQRLTANDYRRFLNNERTSLVNYLCKSLESADNKRHNAAAIVLISFLTGLEVDEVVGLQYGARGDFNLNGDYCRKIEIPKGAYVPKNDLEQLRPQAKAVKLLLPRLLKKWFANLPAKNQKLIDCLNIKDDDLKSDIERLLGTLKKKDNLNRIHQQKISAALHLEIMLLYRDETLCHILASRPHQLPPSNATYICHEASFLQSAYVIPPESRSSYK